MRKISATRGEVRQRCGRPRVPGHGDEAWADYLDEVPGDQEIETAIVNTKKQGGWERQFQD